MAATFCDVPKPTKKRPGIVGVHLLRLRKRAGLSQEGLAEKSGVHRVTIASLESGQHATADVETINKLAKALDVDNADLIAGVSVISQRATETASAMSDPGSTLPPNAVDFIDRMEREGRFDEEVIAAIRTRFRWPELQFATEGELAELAQRTKAFVERAKKWRAARGAGGGERS